MTTSNNSQPPAAGEAAHKIWHPEDQALALRFGWGVFDSDGILQIQRDDEAAVFDCDHNALMQVRNEAKRGDPLALRALAQLGLSNVRACNGHADFVAIIDKVSRYLTGDGRAGDLSDLESIICDVEAVRAKHGLEKAHTKETSA